MSGETPQKNVSEWRPEDLEGRAGVEKATPQPMGTYRGPLRNEKKVMRTVRPRKKDSQGTER